MMIPIHELDIKAQEKAMRLRHSEPRLIVIALPHGNRHRIDIVDDEEWTRLEARHWGWEVVEFPTADSNQQPPAPGGKDR